jgi:hypothetical protein
MSNVGPDYDSIYSSNIFVDGGANSTIQADAYNMTKKEKRNASSIESNGDINHNTPETRASLGMMISRQNPHVMNQSIYQGNQSDFMNCNSNLLRTPQASNDANFNSLQ